MEFTGWKFSEHLTGKNSPGTDNLPLHILLFLVHWVLVAVKEQSEILDIHASLLLELNEIKI